MKPAACAIEALPAGHEPRAVDTLVRAFAEDPAINNLFPDAPGRRARLAHVFGIELRYGLRYGRVDRVPADAAVAIWARPEHTWPTWWRLIRAGILATPLVLGFRAAWRTLRFQHFLESTRRRLLKSPHWYLIAIGVRPGQQGRGLGAALLRHGVERAQATGFPCYLETANARNLPFYEQHGFRVVGERRLPRGGPAIWGLVAGLVRRFPLVSRKPDRFGSPPSADENARKTAETSRLQIAPVSGALKSLSETTG